MILPSYEIVDTMTGEVLDDTCDTATSAWKLQTHLQREFLRPMHIRAARAGAITARAQLDAEPDPSPDVVRKARLRLFRRANRG